jgi:surfactin synthase thioesterase subunit
MPGTDPQAVRLLCLPHAGGGAAWFGNWASALAGVDVLPVQPPGRETRLAEVPFSSMSDLIAALGPAVLPLCRTRFALFGHSMGAHVAFELTRWLRDRGESLPLCLILAGARAPHLPPRDPPLWGLDDTALLASIEILYGSHFEPDMHELVSLTLPTLRADLKVVESSAHQPAAPLPVPMLVLAGHADQGVSLAEARQWQRHTSEEFEFKVLQGQHFFPVTQREATLACVARALAKHAATVA